MLLNMGGVKYQQDVYGYKLRGNIYNKCQPLVLAGVKKQYYKISKK